MSNATYQYHVIVLGGLYKFDINSMEDLSFDEVMQKVGRMIAEGGSHHDAVMNKFKEIGIHNNTGDLNVKVEVERSVHKIS